MENVGTIAERRLPASVACLHENDIAIFSKFKAGLFDRMQIGLAKDGRFLVHISGSFKMGFQWGSSVPEAKKVEGKDYTYLMPATDTFALCVMLAWDDEKIQYTSEDAELKMAELRGLIAIGDLTARVHANYKAFGIVPPHNLCYNAEYPLLSYQQTATYCAQYHPGGYLFGMEQGTGKTPCIISQMCNIAEQVIKEENRMFRAVIVSPNNVRRNWVEEINRFTTHKLRTTVIAGEELARVRQFCDALRVGDEAGTVLIISYDTLVACVGLITGVTWDYAALDEAHYIKNTKTHRYKAAIALRDVSEKRAAATGTYVSNTPLDLYAIWEFLGKGYSGFWSQKGFNKYFGKYRVDPEHGNLLVGVNENKLPLLQERLARMAFTITLKQALPELPEKVYDIIECEMTKEQAALYRKVQSEIQIQIDNELKKDSPSTLVVNNILTLLLKLSQVTSGFLNFPDIYSEDGSGTLVQESHTFVLDENPKLEELVSLMRDKKPHEKTLIWACYKQDILTISNRLRAEGIDGVTFTGDTPEPERQQAMARYNGDIDCKWFLGNQGAGGTGTNLIGYPPHTKDPQTYTNHEIYFSQDWSWVRRSQSEARGHRRGTFTNVRITDLVMPGTVDEDIRAAVLDKKKMSITLGDLRAILARVLTVG